MVRARSSAEHVGQSRTSGSGTLSRVCMAQICFPQTPQVFTAGSSHERSVPARLFQGSRQRGDVDPSAVLNANTSGNATR